MLMSFSLQFVRKKDTITLDTNYVKDRVVAIGKIKKR